MTAKRVSTSPRPARHRVGRKLEDKEEAKSNQSRSHASKKKPQEGVAVAVGPETAAPIGLDVKTGDRVLFGKFSPAAIELAGNDFQILREDEILALVGGTNETPEDAGAGVAHDAEKTEERDLDASRVQSSIRGQAAKLSPAGIQAKRMEEDIEFSNVTKFRNSLLGAVERFQSNPAKRYVITKRGLPEAVLMSYQTYSLLTRLMNKALEGSAGQSREEAIHAAFARLRGEKSPTGPDQAPTDNLEPSAIAEKVREMQQQLDELADKLNRLGPN
jgi:chaperonin GroES